MTKVDLHVYYSTVQKDPSKDKNEKAFSNPLSSMPIVQKGALDKFEMEYVYFSFYSLKGCTIKVESLFKEPVVKLQLGNKKKGNNYDDLDDMDTMVMRNYNKYKQRFERITETNYIEKNQFELRDFEHNKFDRL